MANDEEELWQSEVLVSDSIGRLIEFWGFKRNMGRLWAILYLSDRPLSAPEIQDWRRDMSHEEDTWQSPSASSSKRALGSE